MWFIWIAQDIHRICYVYNYGPPRGKSGQRMCCELWPVFARRRLVFSYCLNVDPRFFLIFRFSLFLFKVFESVTRSWKPSRTVSRNRASDYFYPGSEDFMLKIQFPCYRLFLFASVSAHPAAFILRVAHFPSCRLLYYRKYLFIFFFLVYLFYLTV